MGIYNEARAKGTASSLNRARQKKKTENRTECEEVTMQRNCDMNEISDGRLYELNDMVKANCNDCEGCSACCQGMGSSIKLDPLDIHRLSTKLGLSFEQLLAGYIELNMVDGTILPNLKMAGERERCSFLNEEGRCSIHSFRPGICRIFPLGRIYEEESFKYFLQVQECKKENRSKVKVSKWIDTPDLKKNQQFICDWHYFLKEVQACVKQASNQETVKTLTMYLLNQFFLKGFDAEQDFYEQFNKRLEEAKQVIASV